uniref:S1 motif domain-containing protein n=1 Tax=viral metagenome TaxID=1070528 RepID=A0A6C0F8G8_9ZZZZ|tara:strand:- start:28459 stop:28998 length:540 start_codon:yes stop_codon:yes gene_type:complete
METNERKVFGPYISSILNNKISLSILEVGKNLKQNLEKKIQNSIEGKCIPEGYIRPGSVKILTYSSGNVNNEMIDYQVTFECETCYPPEGHLLECIAKTITKAGIHGEVKDEDGNVPINVFIARDHHVSDNYFGNVKEGDKFLASVIGIRFELNDPYISAIANLKKEYDNRKEKIKIDD